MKDEVLDKINRYKNFEEVKVIINDWMDYHNNESYQWGLNMLSPKQYFLFVTTGFDPLVTFGIK